MITKGIVRNFRANTTLTSLCGAGRIFAEIGQGEPSVLIVQNGNAPLIDGSGLRKSPIQIIVSGFGIDQGENISEAFISAILSLEGSQVADDAKTFTIKTVVHQNGPVLIGWNNVNSWSSNFIINFQQVEN